MSGTEKNNRTDIVLNTQIANRDNDDEEIESQPELQPETEVSAKKLDDHESQNSEVRKKTKRKKKKSRKQNAIGLFSQLFSRLYRAIRNSGTANAITAYDKTAEACRRSFFYSLFFSGKAQKRANDIKVRFRRTATDARLPKLCERLTSSMLMVRTRIYGIIFLIFAITTLAVHYIVGGFLGFSLYTDPYKLPVSVCVCVISLIFVFSNDILSQTLTESKLLGALLFDLMGIKRPSNEREEVIELAPGGACVVGLLLGLLTVVFSPYLLLAFILALVYAAIVIKSPESGMISILVLAPFAPLNVIQTSIVLLGGVYIYKALCGKRSIMLEFPDLIVALFLLTVFLAEGVSFGGIGTHFSSVTFILAYFICVSILRSDIWFERAIRSVVLSTSVMAVFAVILYYVGEYAVSDILKDFSAAEYRDAISHILLYASFMLLAAFLNQKDRKLRFWISIAVVCLAVYLCLTLSPYALIAAIISLAIFSVLCNVKAIFPMVGLAVIRIVMGLFGFSGPILDRISTDKTSLVGSNIMIRLLSQFGFTGIGSSEYADDVISSTVSVGSNPTLLEENSLILRLALELGYIGLILFAVSFFFMLQAVFSHGRKCTDKSDRYRITSYAGMCGLISAVICGIWENIWLSPRMPLIFWLLAGLTVACTRSLASRSDGNEQELLYLKP